MRSFLLMGVLAAAAAVSNGQAASQANLPSDIDPTSLTRLPPVHRQDLDEKGQKIYDSMPGAKGNAPLRGILGLAIYNPELAEALHLLHDSVTKDGTLGNRVNELAILVATREEQMSLNEWYSHEAAARKAGIDPSVIDVIKFGKEPTGLAEKDALVIRFGRELFRERRVRPETFAKAVETFGRRGTVELIGVMGDYAMVAMMLQAVDQQLPGRAPLPPLKTK
jgi:4-carboxymuconolactone decarboxylase